LGTVTGIGTDTGFSLTGLGASFFSGGVSGGEACGRRFTTVNADGACTGTTVLTV
jgi:hypothetical protein